MFAGPRLLSAGESARSAAVDQLPADPERRVVLETLAAMIEGSEAILAVDERESTPLYEIVLWSRDIDGPGTVEADEIVVITHSRALSTVRVHMAEADGTRERIPGRETESPGFADRFRKRPDVEARTVAVGISDVALDRAESEAAGRTVGRFSLTWSAESSDGSEAGWIWLEGPMRATRGFDE